MIRRLLGNEEVGAAMVLALSGAVVVLASRGACPPSPGRLLAGVLLNPIPRRAGLTRPCARHAQAGRRVRHRRPGPPLVGGGLN